MNYAQIRKMDISNGDGIGVSLFVQGCNLHCKGCFNKETWSFNCGKEFTLETKQQILELLDRPYISRFSILGGEPLDEKNIPEVACIINLVKEQHPDKKIYVWTGYEYNYLKAKENKQLNFILNNIDYLIAGPFIEEEKDLTLKWRGSRNQQIIKMK